MNYREYRKHLDDNQLIESLESIQCLADAIQLNENIKTIKSMSEDELALYGSFDLDPRELITHFEERKDDLIRMALKLCCPKKKPLRILENYMSFK